MVSRTDSHWIFRVPSIQTRQLFLAGQFNGWGTTATPMAEVEPGVWEVSIHLQPGEYRFRYVTDDGRWFTDYAAFGVVRNDFGGWDSVVYVPQTNEVTKPSIGQDPLAAAESCQLKELMVLIWCLTKKGDSGCGGEDDLFENLNRRNARGQDHVVAAHAMAAPQINHKNMAKRSQKSPAGGGQGTKLPKQKKRNCLLEVAGAL